MKIRMHLTVRFLEMQAAGLALGRMTGAVETVMPENEALEAGLAAVTRAEVDLTVEKMPLAGQQAVLAYPARETAIGCGLAECLDDVLFPRTMLPGSAAQRG